MAEVAGTEIPGARSPWWLRALYVLLLVSALSLVTLIVGDIVYAFESNRDEHDTHSHGFYGPIFDAAWIAFAPTFVFTLVAGLAALGAGLIRRSAGTIRYGATALGFCTVAVVVIAIVESL